MRVKAFVFLFMFIFVFQLLSAQVKASADLYLGLASAVPSKTHSNNLYEVALGDACNVMLGVQQVLPCNPAFMDQIKGKSFQASFLSDENLNFLSGIDDVHNSDKSYELIRDLFNKKDILDAQAVVQLSFRNDIYGLEIIPLKTSAWVLSRDSANPKLAVQILSEKSIAGTVGGKLNEKHSVGLKLRFLIREVIRDEFSLLRATLGTDGIMNKQTQEAIQIEPGYAYFVENEWRTRVSASIKNWEVQNQHIEGVFSKPQLIWGIGATPYAKSFIWDLGLTHRARGGFEEGLTLTSQTHFKDVSWFSMAAKGQYSLGGSLLMRDFQVSFSFSEKSYDELDKGFPLQQSYLFEVSYTF
jgi:hypothetical protein